MYKYLPLLLTAAMCAASSVCSGAQTNVPITVVPAPVSSGQSLVALHLAYNSHGNTWNSPNVLGGAGSANAVVGTLAITQKPLPSSFTGTWAITGGADASKFTVDANTGVVRIGSSDLPVNPSNNCTSRQGGLPCYSVVFTATQPGAKNSPFTDQIDFYVVDPASSPPTLTVDKNAANIGDTITATLSNNPNPNGKDCLALYLMIGHDHTTTTQGSEGSNGGFNTNQGIDLTGHGGSYSFTVPNLPSDWWKSFSVVLLRDCYSPRTIASSWVYVPPTAPPAMPTQTYSFADPFTPAHTVTVCPVGGGCDYTVPSAAYSAARDLGWDNVLVKIKGTVYNDCVSMKIGVGSGSVGHLWFKGTGGDFAHIECVQGATFSLSNQGATASPAPMLVLENVEMSDSPSKGILSGAFFYQYNQTLVWLRNVYIHDGFDQGIFLNASNCCGNPNPDQNSAPRNAYSVKIENSRIARAGGAAGPAHNMYVEFPDEFDFYYSLTESANIGHTLKTRARKTDIVCSKMLQSYNPGSPSVGVWGGGSAIDFSEGFNSNISNSVIGWGCEYWRQSNYNEVRQRSGSGQFF
jgi:hypothetical protein